MKLHYLQHVPFEDLANIKSWCQVNRFDITSTALYLDQKLPSEQDIDWVIILGGPMNIYEDHKYPWLKDEKIFVEKAIKAGKIVIGFCLGAQIIADVLGAKVFPNKHKEIGWFPVTLTEQSIHLPLFKGIPEQLDAFHWHGDTFTLPDEAKLLATSKACHNQGFIYSSTVVALQFHLEYNLNSIEKMIEHCSSDIIEGPYIQHKQAMLDAEKLHYLDKHLTVFLDNLYNLHRH